MKLKKFLLGTSAFLLAFSIVLHWFGGIVAGLIATLLIGALLIVNGYLFKKTPKWWAAMVLLVISIFIFKGSLPETKISKNVVKVDIPPLNFSDYSIVTEEPNKGANSGYEEIVMVTDTDSDAVKEVTSEDGENVDSKSEDTVSQNSEDNSVEKDDTKTEEDKSKFTTETASSNSTSQGAKEDCEEKNDNKSEESNSKSAATEKTSSEPVEKVVIKEVPVEKVVIKEVPVEVEKVVTEYVEVPVVEYVEVEIESTPATTTTPTTTTSQPSNNNYYGAYMGDPTVYNSGYGYMGYQTNNNYGYGYGYSYTGDPTSAGYNNNYYNNGYYSSATKISGETDVTAGETYTYTISGISSISKSNLDIPNNVRIEKVSGNKVTLYFAEDWTGTYSIGYGSAVINVTVSSAD